MFHLQVTSTVGISPLLLEKNNTKGSLAGVALARKQSNKTLYLRACSYFETFVHFDSKRPQEKPSLSRLQLILGLAQPQPHSPDLLGISLNFCFAPPLLITARSWGLQGLSWQSNRFGLSFEPCLGWSAILTTVKDYGGPGEPSEQQTAVYFLSPHWWYTGGNLDLNSSKGNFTLAVGVSW